MAELTHKEKWWAAMIKKHGSKKAVLEYQRAAQKRSRLNYTGNGGFRSMSAEKRREVAQKGAQARWSARIDSNETNSQSQKETEPEQS